MSAANALIAPQGACAGGGTFPSPLNAKLRVTRLERPAGVWLRGRSTHRPQLRCCVGSLASAARPGRDGARASRGLGLARAVPQEVKDWLRPLWGKGSNATEDVEYIPWFEDDDVTLLHSETSDYNIIKVVQVARHSDQPLAGARVLILDGPGNIHSMYFPYKAWTDSYYDRFAALPPLIPRGSTIGILGLAAGTAARAIACAWPEQDMVGWELDPRVIAVAREFLDLGEIEVQPGKQDASSKYKPLVPRGSSGWGITPGMGRLRVVVGDALHPEAVVEGGFGGLVVDMFAGGVVIPQLQQVDTWQALLGRLRPGGRVMVNCGGGCVESESGDAEEGERVMWQTLAALRTALPADETLLCRRLDGEDGNVMALSVGCLEDLEVWMDCNLPAQVVDSITDWIPYEIFADAFLKSNILSKHSS